MHPARGLKAYDAATLLASAVRSAIRKFPRHSQFLLGDQLTRSAESIGANLAEGSARAGAADRARFFRIALSSGHETLHHLNSCHDATLLDTRTYRQIRNLANVTCRMIAALLRRP